MGRKSLKFRDHLARLVKSGEKTTTWRLFDDKDLQVGDHIDLINKDSGELFGEAVLTEVYEKKLGELSERDFEGHEKFVNDEEMYQTYRTHYGDRVSPETIVKIVRFKLLT